MRPHAATLNQRLFTHCSKPVPRTCCIARPYAMVSSNPLATKAMPLHLSANAAEEPY